MIFSTEKRELAKMTTHELKAYRRICQMSKKMITTDKARWVRHERFVNEILAAKE